MASSRVNNSAPKSIPDSRVILSLANNALLGGTSPVLGGTTADVFDLGALGEYHEGLLRIEIKIKTGLGGTPTAPGADKTLSVGWNFLSEDLSLTLNPDTFPDVFENSSINGICELVDDDDAYRVYQSDPFLYGGRFLHFWYAVDALPANAQLSLVVRLVRI